MGGMAKATTAAGAIIATTAIAGMFLLAAQ